MLANLHLPDSSQADLQVFNANSSAAGQSWHTWNKRRGATMVQIICIGGAAAGGSGVIGANGAAGGGGGGGGANVSILTIPAFLIPDSLYVSVGMGGKGATSGTPASGIASYVAVQKTTAAGAGVIAQQCLLAANASAGAAGMNASAGTAGAAGAQPTAQAVTDCPLSQLGTTFFFRGPVGTAGGTSTTTATVGGVNTYTTSLGITMGGTGGGGVHQTAANNGLAGGAVTALANSIYPGQVGAAGGTSSVLAFDGANGYQTIPGLLQFTGAGGGGAGYSAAGAFAVGGRGGNGMPGCGGGGSGGSFTGATAKPAGDGGDGLVIITSW